MSQPVITPEERYAALVEAVRSHAGVTHAADPAPARKSFGATELKVNGKIFAMLVRDQLVVKLPKARVDALVAAGEGARFDPRHDGRLMKEWFVLTSSSPTVWLSLAQEALAFVSGER